MEKIFKTREVLDKHSDSAILWKDVKYFVFEDDDVLNVGYEEAFYGSDSAHDGFYYFNVMREVLETDEEFELRKDDSAREKERLRKDRYQRYLKLKAEFENGIN
jgi:inorganic pyrophosphatase/exopolyphosphatase